MNLFGVSLGNYFQQLAFPRLNLRLFPPSATIWIVSFTFIGIFHLWFLKWIPLIDIILTPNRVFDIQTIDDVAWLVTGKRDIGRKVQVYSMFDPDYWNGFLEILEEGERKELLKNLFDKMTFTDNGFECIGNVLDEDSSVHSICMGFFNIETHGKSQVDFQVGKPLQVRYLGDTKYFSVGFSSQFPYFEEFNTALYGIVESGLYQYWTKQAWQVEVGPQNRIENTKKEPGRVNFDLFWMAVRAMVICYGIATVVFVIEVIVGHGLHKKAWRGIYFVGKKVIGLGKAGACACWSNVRLFTNWLWSLVRRKRKENRVTPLTSEQIEKLSRRQFREDPALQFLR